ncbi:MAG: PadR family transcriptional regulator [Candidatus Hodarchaeota archaeon]
MIGNNDIEKIEEIVDSFDNAMKKGFISALILLVLEKEKSYGYKIAEEIDELTSSVFQPTVSTLYPLLKSLSNKDLINCIEVDDSGRKKKIYEITTKGQETLKMLIQKHQMMVDSIKNMIIDTLGITDETSPSFLEDLEKLITTPQMELIKVKSMESKKDILNYHKKLLEERIKNMQKNIKTIDNILSKLDKKGEKDLVETPSKKIASH